MYQPSTLRDLDLSEWFNLHKMILTCRSTRFINRTRGRLTCYKYQPCCRDWYCRFSYSNNSNTAQKHHAHILGSWQICMAHHLFFLLLFSSFSFHTLEKQRARDLTPDALFFMEYSRITRTCGLECDTMRWTHTCVDKRSNINAGSRGENISAP